VPLFLLLYIGRIWEFDLVATGPADDATINKVTFA